nr:hypothetical protein Iba_chr01bCG0300 [Ipomoea batatas]
MTRHDRLWVAALDPGVYTYKRWPKPPRVASRDLYPILTNQIFPPRASRVSSGFYLSLKFAFHLATIPREPLDCSFGAIRTNLDGPNASDNLPALLISSSKSSIGHCTFLLDIFSSTKARSTMIPTAKLIAIPKILLLPSPLLEADDGGCWRPMLLTAQGEIIFPQSPAFPSKLKLGKLKN